MFRVLAHASRRLWSWLIFDVGQKMNAPELLREVSIPGLCKVSIPASATQELIEDGSTLALHVRPGSEAIYVKRYDLPAQCSSIPAALESEAGRFLREGILSVCDAVVGSNIESGEMNGAYYAQLVAAISDSHWWIARLIAKPDAKSYFLLHCHGDRDYLALAVAIFSEFYVLE